MKKQIKEMALGICKNVMPNGNCHKDNMPCDFDCVYGVCAQRLYNAGYRKQGEGEWLCIYLNKFEHLSKHKCSECGFVNTTRYNYCPNCGAKMKED